MSFATNIGFDPTFPFFILGAFFCCEGYMCILNTI